MNNLLNINGIPENEVFEEILKGKEFTIERIISPPMPAGDSKWYNQNSNEIVFLIQGKAAIEFEDNSTIYLTAGDYLIIKAHRKHRIAFTGSEPLSVWLAIHYYD